MASASPGKLSTKHKVTEHLNNPSDPMEREGPAHVQLWEPDTDRPYLKTNLREVQCRGQATDNHMTGPSLAIQSLSACERSRELEITRMKHLRNGWNRSHRRLYATNHRLAHAVTKEDELTHDRSSCDETTSKPHENKRHEAPPTRRQAEEYPMHRRSILLERRNLNINLLRNRFMAKDAVDLKFKTMDGWYRNHKSRHSDLSLPLLALLEHQDTDELAPGVFLILKKRSRERFMNQPGFKIGLVLPHFIEMSFYWNEPVW